jgi:DUF4097 and DUF4098 domain-containing protein YvlB
MRFNPLLLLLPAAALLLGESQPGVPGKPIEVRTSNGAVAITGSDGASESHTVIVGQNESLTLQVPRNAALNVITSNGAIHVSGVTGALHLFTSNGAIELILPSGINANLSARTSNAQIRSEIRVTATHAGTNFLEGTIGAGGPLIELHTSNAPIHIRYDSQQESVSSIFRPGEVR